jgi:hypothetical protein
MLRCSVGCCCCGVIIVGIVIVGDGIVFCILWVVAMFVGGGVQCSSVVVLFDGVGMVCEFVCVVEEWGCGVRVIDGLCTLVVVVFAAGVGVAGGAASFLGACQKTCVAFLGLPPNC